MDHHLFFFGTWMRDFPSSSIYASSSIKKGTKLMGREAEPPGRLGIIDRAGEMEIDHQNSLELIDWWCWIEFSLNSTRPAETMDDVSACIVYLRLLLSCPPLLSSSRQGEKAFCLFQFDLPPFCLLLNVQFHWPSGREGGRALIAIFPTHRLTCVVS